ncbi:glucosamine-6-phosphate deaminase [Microbacterium sp. EST19A]|uniref:glucosamine-6-phosphate deaminase n=1 Tax=Microbacterium sp. EST19A TaxID=2862681 RepID=UPI001CBB3234|nr:glucosamine-6-phosphate deaminase [Microbacterium sp. EST19A]
MQIVILATTDDIETFTGDYILNRIEAGHLRVLGVATGSSPLPVYRGLAKRWTPKVGALTAFALDEYVGLDYSHPESYHAVVDREVTQPLRLDPMRVHVPDGNAPDLDAAAADYESLIAQSGGVDLQILGIGTTGHIGFNEPTSSLNSRTRVKTLALQTRADNARFFDAPELVPSLCLTQGLGTILDAAEILMVAQGESKAHAIAQAVEGPLTAMCPASVLQLHPRATIVLDEAAASELLHSDYYRYVFAQQRGITHPGLIDPGRSATAN